MENFVDRAINIGMGLEKKFREVLEELEGRGKGTEAKAGEEKLPPKQRLENRLVEDGVKAVKELLKVLKEGRDKIEGDVASATEKLSGKLNLATKDDLDVVKEMARVAREKVDRLEKTVNELLKGKGVE
ncbi:MAG: accessory factor UbiK family protein [Deltaproteobacteria bacterium]|nr:accessory factor UbiK family protein [Deltaproteobacteria bacterium]